MKKTSWIILGFLFFIIGFTSLVLSMIGLQLSYLAWMDQMGGLYSFLVKILMVVAGIVIVYLSYSDWRSEEEF
ncbi:MAG: hypothetical protein RI973_15 [Bacteroidota bacterium]|jgi:hypothetical protein